MMFEISDKSDLDNILKRLTELLDNTQPTSRAILGTDKKLLFNEIRPFNFYLISKNYNNWIEKLENKLFILDSIKEVFYYIFNSSVSKSLVKPLFFNKKKYLQLPDIFKRYFNKQESTYKLSYLTINRMKNVLFPTLKFFQNNLSSRHIYFPIWNATDNRKLDSMVPSLIGFHVQIFQNELLTSVIIRSCDIDFFLYDFWYFLKITNFIHNYLNIKIKSLKLSMNIFNFHKKSL